MIAKESVNDPQHPLAGCRHRRFWRGGDRQLSPTSRCQLRYGDPGPPDATIHTDLVAPWAEKVNKESGGTLNIKVFAGYTLVNMLNTLDRVTNGVADFAFCILGPVSSQFPKTLVATLPFEAENAHEAGLALQRLYDKGVIADEWKKVKPIGFGVFANLSYHTIPPVKTHGRSQRPQDQRAGPARQRDAASARRHADLAADQRSL